MKTTHKVSSQTKSSGSASKRKPVTKKDAKTAMKPPAVSALEPSSKTWSRVNRQQLAQLLGVHPDTVTDFARSGMPVIERGGAGRESVYDAVECLTWWRERQGKNAKEAAQTRAYEATAALNEQRLQERRKELVARDQVILAGQSYTKAWTAKVRALPRRFVEAGVLTREQEEAAAKVCRDVLTEIASMRMVAGVPLTPRRKRT